MLPDRSRYTDVQYQCQITRVSVLPKRPWEFPRSFGSSYIVHCDILCSRSYYISYHGPLSFLFSLLVARGPLFRVGCPFAFAQPCFGSSGPSVPTPTAGASRLKLWTMLSMLHSGDGRTVGFGCTFTCHKHQDPMGFTGLTMSMRGVGETAGGIGARPPASGGSRPGWTSRNVPTGVITSLGCLTGALLGIVCVCFEGGTHLVFVAWGQGAEGMVHGPPGFALCLLFLGVMSGSGSAGAMKKTDWAWLGTTARGRASCSCTSEGEDLE